MVITDGDYQETSQVDSAIELLYPNMIQSRCGWNIINRGWLKWYPGKSACTIQDQREWWTIMKVIQCWMYSWMLPGYCETEVEYLQSR